MRRVLVLTLSIFLVSSSLNMASANAPRAGAACKKVGTVVISKNREFTCVKRGSKRVWSKGVAVKASPAPSPTPTPTPTPTPVVTPTPTPTPTVREYTRADVAQRNTPSNCWSIVDGNVYDLTSWIGAHPGGPGVIRALCGVDGSAMFKSQHGKSARPNSILESYLLGPLRS